MTASKKAPALAFVHPSELHTYHQNSRIGNVEIIEGSLMVNDQYKPLIVNKGTHTGRKNEVLTGNHTLKAIRSLGEKYPDDERWHLVMVLFTDVDNDRAATINIVDNKASDESVYDDAALYEQLSQLPELAGTGFNDEEFAKLGELAALFSGPADGEGAADHNVTDSTDVTIDLGKVPSQCAEIGATVGVVRMKVPRTVYEPWYDELRESAGYETKDLQAEILRRLGLA